MKKPIRPIHPEPPEILKDNVFHIETTYSETIYETPTNLKVELDKFQKTNPSATNEETIEYFRDNFSWDIYVEKDGSFCDEGSRDDEGPNELSQEPISLSYLLSKISAKDFPNVKIQGTANYKGDFIYGPPGIKVTIERKNDFYEEMLEAQKEYKQKLNEWYNAENKYIREYELYEEHRKKLIEAKIKEMEDTGEI